MNVMLNRPPAGEWQQGMNLEARPLGDLWRMWRSIGIALLVRAARPLPLWIRRARQRGVLASLSTRDLHDIGVTPGDAYREIRKPFWIG